MIVKVGWGKNLIVKGGWWKINLKLREDGRNKSDS